MNRRIMSATLLFLGLLFIPHSLLGFNGAYLPKLRVLPEPNTEYLIGVGFALLFLVVFLICAEIARFSRATLKQHVLGIEQRRSFRFIMLALTFVMFALLTAGIGAKQSENALNFLIRLFPRELLLIISVVAAVATRKWFWIVLMLLNVFYWVAIGSKASLFLVLLALLYYHTLEQTRMKPVYVLWGLFLLLILPVSYLVPVAFRLGVSVPELFIALYQNPELTAMFAGRILGRISWFDGMLLTAQDVAPLAHYTLLDFLDVALAGFIPGMTAAESPFGLQVIYLFNAVDLENFAGAIGIPGTLKAITYNSGVLGLTGMLVLLGLVLVAVMRMTASRNPFLALLGFSTLIILMLTLFISGNVDSALGKIAPLILSGLFYFKLSRSLFAARTYGLG